MDGFQIRKIDHRMVVTGELDAATAPELAAALDAIGTDDVEVDIAHVGFIDSSGLRALLVARQRNPSIRVVGATPGALRVFEIAGVAENIVGTGV
jgi:anti-sigma B factor antagonist